MTPKQRKQRGRWLLSAIRNERVDRALELICQGADLSVVTPEGDPVVYLALAFNCYPAVRPLLESGADPNVPGSYDTYPIHIAAEYGGEHAPELLEALISHGARIDVRDDEGATAMFRAGKAASTETIQTLLRHGASIHDRNNQLDTPLTFACCWGYTERAAMLLEFGVDADAQDYTGMTALHWAAKNGHAGTIALLLAHGVRVDVADEWGCTPLMRAAAYGSRLCVDHLLAAGADPTLQDTEGCTALDAARRFAGCDLAEAMLNDGCSCRGPVCDERPLVERITTPDGEPAVQIGLLNEDGSGWILEKCDGFDAVVESLHIASVA